MSKPTLKLQLPETQIEAVILKTLKQADAIYFLVGEEHSDHDLWVANKEQPIKLVGTFKESTYTKIRKTKSGEEVALQLTDYEFTNPLVEPPLLLKATTVGAVKFDLTNYLPALF